MTEMRRVTISLPNEIDEKILKLRQDEHFARCTYSEIVRRALVRGLDRMTAQPQAGQDSA